MLTSYAAASTTDCLHTPFYLTETCSSGLPFIFVLLLITDQLLLIHNVTLYSTGFNYITVTDFRSYLIENKMHLYNKDRSVDFITTTYENRIQSVVYIVTTEI